MITLASFIDLFSENPEEGSILLYYNARNTDYYQGLLHVWLNDQWGTVSRDSWTDENLDTVCRQLGKDGMIMVDTGAAESQQSLGMIGLMHIIIAHAQINT